MHTCRFPSVFKQRTFSNVVPVVERDDESDTEEEENVYFALCEDDRVGIELIEMILNPY